MAGVHYWLATPIGDLATFAAESGYLVTWSIFLDLANMSKRRRSDMPLTSDPEVVLQYLDMSSDDDGGSDD